MTLHPANEERPGEPVRAQPTHQQTGHCRSRQGAGPMASDSRGAPSPQEAAELAAGPPVLGRGRRLHGGPAERRSGQPSPALPDPGPHCGPTDSRCEGLTWPLFPVPAHTTRPCGAAECVSAAGVSGGVPTQPPRRKHFTELRTLKSQTSEILADRTQQGRSRGHGLCPWQRGPSTWTAAAGPSGPGTARLRAAGVENTLGVLGVRAPASGCSGVRELGGPAALPSRPGGKAAST